MEEKYHVVVTVAYCVIAAVIISVMRASLLDRISVWVVSALFFIGVLRLIRKGIDPPRHSD